MKTIKVRTKTENGYEYVTIDTPEVVRVFAEELTKGYRYTAELADGTRQVIRAKATRFYPNAFMYPTVVASGKTDLASVFSFGKSPTASYGRADRTPIAQFTIELK